MNKSIQAVRGMNDILPVEADKWRLVEMILTHTLECFGYQEVRFPILEKTELFKRTIGEITDIVEKEMYTFTDRNDESLTLRPEGTAGCVRAGIEHGLLYNQIQRLWYLGPYFRHERPQKGRYRQFYQCGAEFFGIATPDADAELIQLSATIFKNLKILDKVKLEINTLGSPATRKQYRELLINYFQNHYESLDDDSKRRLTTNPLRILDSKNPAMQELNHNAPKLVDHLDQESKDHFIQLQDYLTASNIPFTINPCLVRGLDYYTKTVFEWTTEDLGAQGTVCAGGRYDGLVEQLGGKSTPALGFAIGMERLILLAEQANTLPAFRPDIYFMSDNIETFKKASALANELRQYALKIILHCGAGSFKNQFKKADKSGARYALLLGENELNDEVVTIKFLREEKPQETIPWNDLLSYFHSLARKGVLS